MSYKKHYNGDPKWIWAKFKSACSRCSNVIRRGESAFYYPLSKAILCTGIDCGTNASNEFDAILLDEQIMGGRF